MENMVKLNGLLNSDKPVLVEFFATWCPHCQRMKPVLDKVERRSKAGLKIERFDIDAPANASLIDYYKIQSVPTMLLFHKGEQVWRKSGEIAADQLEDIIGSYE